MSNNVFDFVNSVSYNKQDLLANGTHSSNDYVPFVVNRTLSYFPDTVLFANEMNQYSHLSNEQQYYYFLYAVRKNRRFAGKWAKVIANEDLEAVKVYYKLNNQKALEVMKLLRPEQLEMIKKRVHHGGEQGGKG